MMTWSTLLDGEPLRRLTDERRRQLSRQWGRRKRPSGPTAK
jgi:hypothetical protein